MHDADKSATSRGFGLEWGSRESLLAYVGRLPDGDIRATEGAEFDGASVFRFPLHRAIRGGDDAVEAWFLGTAELYGYEGMLYIAVKDPHVSIREGRLLLRGTDPVTGECLDVAAGSVDARATRDGVLSVTAEHPRLSEAAADMFAHQYPAGAELAAIRVKIPSQ